MHGLIFADERIPKSSREYGLVFNKIGSFKESFRIPKSSREYGLVFNKIGSFKESFKTIRHYLKKDHEKFLFLLWI